MIRATHAATESATAREGDRTDSSTSPRPVRDTLKGMVLGWDRFWFTPADPTTLAFMRLCCGLLVFYVHLTYSWGLLSYVGPEAWLDKPVADYVQRELPIYSLTADWGDRMVQISKGTYDWSIYYHVTSTGWIIAIHGFFLVCMLLFAAGLWTPVTGALSWIGASSYVHRATSTVFGLDTMMMIVLLYLLIGPSGATLSLDRWLQKRRARRRGEPVPEVAPSIAANFALRMTQIHFCIIYLATGTSKLLGVTWWDGTALNLVLLNAAFAPLDNDLYYRVVRFLASYRPLWEAVMTAGIAYTLLLEIAFPFLVWDRRTRWVMICGSVLLHTGIGLLMGLTTFSLMMMVMVSSFIPPEQVRIVLQALESAARRLYRPRAEPRTVPAGELALSP